MANYNIIKIKFNRRPLHLSDGRGLYYSSEGILHSDTLKNAIFTSVLKLRGKKAVNVSKEFYNSFFLSSALPFYLDEYFFPRPLGHFSTDAVKAKKEKKIKYIGKSLFEKWLSTGRISMAGIADFGEGQFISSNLRGKVTKEDKIIYRQVQERVRIKRNDNGDSEPYFMEQIRFKEGAGLYFFIQHAPEISEEYKSWIKQGLNLLADEGLGSDKTYGFGQFDIIGAEGEDSFIHPFSLNVPDDANAWYATGLYTPSDSEKSDLSWLKNAGYQITERGGYLANPSNPKYRSFRRNTGRFLQIGSVIPKMSIPEGQCLDLMPKDMGTHPVWREGRTVFLPAKINARV